MEISGLSVVILETASAVAVRAELELAQLARRRPNALVSMAAGETFQPILASIEAEWQSGRLDLAQMRFTHHDEFLGCSPDDPGGLAHELLTCAPIREAQAAGRFVPMPSAGTAEQFREHEAYLARLGGVDLQFLGIGSNGNVACCEPGTPFDRGYHKVTLADVTRAHITRRFAPGTAVPSEAITAGPASILGARRVVLVATGNAKAAAVRGMLDEGVTATCPASLLRRHPDVVVLLDSAAAAALDWPQVASAGQA